MSAAAERRRARSGARLALDNLCAIVVLLVLSFHSVLAYLRFLPPRPYPFDAPPYHWAAIPIVDPHRWLGFDIFCAWQDVFLMTLFFFLSGLFVWPSLVRKGPGRFLRERFLRLGMPFAVVVALLMPVAAYPIYLQSAADPSLTAFWKDLANLPFWPSGPMWFLWLLLVGDVAAEAVDDPVGASGCNMRCLPWRCRLSPRPAASSRPSCCSAGRRARRCAACRRRRKSWAARSRRASRRGLPRPRAGIWRCGRSRGATPARTVRRRVRHAACAARFRA